jgi:hypothetical protein
MGTLVEDAIKLQKFRLLSFLAQKFERDNIELARQALEAVKKSVVEAQKWLGALNLPELANLSGKLNEIKRKAGEWQGILGDIWGNRGKLKEISDELNTESSKFEAEILSEIEKLRGGRGLDRKEQDRLFVLKEKLNELVTYLKVAKLWIDKIREEIRAGKGR